MLFFVKENLTKIKLKRKIQSISINQYRPRGFNRLKPLVISRDGRIVPSLYMHRMCYKHKHICRHLKSAQLCEQSNFL